LHPTAAVCGQPREIAAAAIEQLESFERGFFTGAVGWCDSAGDGQWMVTIRCAEVHGNRARLYAGAGIVTGSDPEAEAAETSAKFQTLLRAMGIDETGRALDEAAA
jgi:isochorismate synthase